MKLKSNLYIILMIVLVLFTVSVVSAGDNQTEVFEDDDYHNYTDLDSDISSAVDTFYFQHNYKHAADEKRIINLNPGNLTINGNNHIIDGSNNARAFRFLFD